MYGLYSLGKGIVAPGGKSPITNGDHLDPHLLIYLDSTESHASINAFAKIGSLPVHPVKRAPR